MFKKIVFVLLLLVIGVVVYLSLETNVTDQTDDYVYDLPYSPGSAHQIVQGYGGRFSHAYKAALDFGMPIGTPVYAARGGVVFSSKDDSNEGGPLPKYNDKANYIIIKHEDGSFGCYWHLKQNGVVIKRGRVKKGALIGYSGSTGFVLRPHLHFAVKRVLNYEMNSFVKTKFNTTEGIVFLEKGKEYQSPALKADQP